MPIIGGTRSGYFSCYGAIVGGSPNCIDAGDGTPSIYGFIGGGSGNTICAGTCFSSIVGGSNNTNSGYYSAILGGSGNVIPAGLSFAAVFGNGLTAHRSNTLHVGCLNALNTPPFTTGYPLGTIYFSASCPFAGAKQLYII